MAPITEEKSINSSTWRSLSTGSTATALDRLLNACVQSTPHPLSRLVVCNMAWPVDLYEQVDDCYGRPLPSEVYSH